MSFKKEYIEKDSACRVTFMLTKEAVGNAQSVHLVGESDNWKEKKIPMERKKDGSFRVTITLKKGDEYQFRYLVNDETLINDWFADTYKTSDVPDEEDGRSVLVV